MNPRHIYLPTAAVFLLASPVVAQSLPSDVFGRWDISAAECRTPGTSFTQIDIGAESIDTYGGDAIIREIDLSGPVTFVAADFLQTEGAAEPGRRKRTYFRLTQRDGPDRLNLIWKDVQTVDLVRCDTADPRDPSHEKDAGEPLDRSETIPPIEPGLWVIAGGDCKDPSNAAWRTFDGRGLDGSQSSRCEIDAVSNDDDRYVIEQTCTATYEVS